MNKVKYTQLSPVLQEKLHNDGLAYYTIKGSRNPKEKIDKYLSNANKTRKAWRHKRYFYLVGIDFYREKIGMSKLYT